jgi:hypothetical protein
VTNAGLFLNIHTMKTAAFGPLDGVEFVVIPLPGVLGLPGASSSELQTGNQQAASLAVRSP